MIERINIIGFRSHRGTVIDDLKRVNWFLGKNATGKSSIVDALAYAFTGICRGTDRGGRGADVLVSDFKDVGTPTTFNLGVKDSAWMINRIGPGQGPTSEAQKKITAMVGASPALLNALTDLSNVLDASPKEQQGLLEQVLGIQVNPAIVGEALGGNRDVMAMHSMESLDDLIAFEKFATEQRTLTGRTQGPSIIANLNTLPEFASWTLQEAEQGLKDVEAKLYALIEKRGALGPQRPAGARP